MRVTPRRQHGTRGVAAAALIVFLGLFLLVAVVGAGFYVATTGGGGGGDPTKLELSPSRCGVLTQNGTTGVGTITVSLTYRGSDAVDLSDATLRYTDDETTHEFDVGPNASSETIRVVNGSGAYDPVVDGDEASSLTVPLTTVRDGPLPPATRASVELIVADVSTGGTTFRTPGAIGRDSTYVDC